MPHQCLGCGHAFQEGSSELLNGCPQCQGSRFFYTEEPLPLSELTAMQERNHDDVGHMVAELLADAAPEAAAELQARADSDGWAAIKPKDLRAIVKKVKARPAAVAGDEPADSPQRVAAAQAARERILAELAAQDEEESRPDTVDVQGTGNYAIDVKGLLERDPIVVHKDGAYLIHLPSLFDK